MVRIVMVDRSAHFMATSTQISRPKSVRVRSDLVGVRGWLHFFVLLTIYIWPIANVLWCIAIWIQRCIPLSPDYPGVILYYPICIAGTLYLALMSNEVGHGLQNRAPRAVQAAKKWMLMVLAWPFAWLVLSPICGGAMSDIAQDAAYNIVRTLVWFAIWFTYFSFSQQVRATYPDSTDR
jgi:hypothetical protein